MTLLLIVSDTELRAKIAAACAGDPDVELLDLDDTRAPRATMPTQLADVVVLLLRVSRWRSLTRTSRQAANLRCVLFRTERAPNNPFAGAGAGAGAIGQIGEVDASVDGFLLRRVDPERMIAAIKLIHRGRRILDPALARKTLLNLPPVDLGPAARTPQLSSREREVVELVARGMRNGEIARQLNISVRTVKGHLANIMSKLATRNRVETVMAALRLRLVGEESRPAAAEQS